MIQHSSKATFQQPFAYIPECQPTSSGYPMDDVPEGPGSVSTHSNTEALSVGMRQH